MKAKNGWLKMAICAAFIGLFAAAILLSSGLNTSALKSSETNLENPQNCAACHQENYASWHQSAHRKTVSRATAETVKGDFGRENFLEYAGAKASMTSDGESFFIEIGEEKYRVAAVVGVKYIEQYIAEKDGEFYSLPIAYDLTEKRWIHLNDADFGKKDADFSRHLQNWKTDCAACHQAQTGDASNPSADFGVSCAACHGNAAEHLAAKNSLLAKIGFQTESKIVNPRNLSSDAAMSVCARCHARDSVERPRIEEIADEKYAAKLASAHQKKDFDASGFWSDGSNKFSGNEYQAVLRSVCYLQSKAGGHGIAGAKINCASCHSTHESKGEFAAPEKSYNQMCVNCHAQFADDAAVAEHTKHPLNSAASDCASCHQPETVYGRMRFARTHEISVPNPVLTVEKQIPNACNLCHADKSVNWAIASSKNLWAERFRASEISSDKQFDQPEGIRALFSDDPFRRALAADSLSKHSDPNWSAPFLFAASQTEKFSLVNYFLADAVKFNKLNALKDSRSK